MSYNQTTGNPPNPTQAHAGATPGQEFFRNLAETINAAHANNNLHIYSQGFRHDSFRIIGSNSATDQIEVRAPTISRAHDSVAVIFRARHVQHASSFGKLTVRIYDGASSGTLIGSKDVTITGTTTHVLHTATISSLVITQPFVTIQIGLSNSISATGSPESICQDVAVSWIPVSAVSTTKSEDGPIIPIGTGPTSTDEPISAALGYCFGSTINTLKKRTRSIASVSGIEFTNGASSTDLQHIHPFVRPHIIRVQNSTKPLTINYYIRAQNAHATETRNLRIQAIDPRSLFQFPQSHPNHFSSSGERGEFLELSVAANTTETLTGTFQIHPPFQQFQSVADGHFIALAVGTRAMAPRAPMRYNDGNDFDINLKIKGYSFWSE